MVYTCTNGYTGNLYLDAGDTMQFFASENDDNQRHVLSTQKRDFRTNFTTPGLRNCVYIVQCLF